MNNLKTANMKRTMTLMTIMLGFALLTGCNFGDLKLPKFKTGTDSLIAEIKQTGNFENVTFGTTETTYKDSTDRYLNLQLLNGTALPKGDSLLRELGRKVMIMVVNSLENSSDYNNFQVEFIAKAEIGLVNYSSSNRYTYKIEDLQ
jgi:hypothetical protein